MVYGSIPKVFEKKNDLSKAARMEKILDFYNQNKRGVYLYCLEAMAGYNSYKVFIDNRSNYFGLIKQSDFSNLKENNIVNYYPLRNAPSNIAFGHWTVKDIVDCYIKLMYIGLTNKESKDEYLTKVILDLDKIMSNKEVQSAIKLTKDELIKFNGKRIEGEQLSNLILKVAKILEQIFISKFIDNDKLENKN